MSRPSSIRRRVCSGSSAGSVDVDIGGLRERRQLHHGHRDTGGRERVLHDAGREPHGASRPTTTTSRNAHDVITSRGVKRGFAAVARDDLFVRGHGGHFRGDPRMQVAQAGVELFARHEIGEPVVGVRHEALAEEHREPAIAREEAILEIGHVAARRRKA